MSKDDKDDITPASVTCIRCKKESSYFSETVQQYRYKDLTGWLCNKCARTVGKNKSINKDDKEDAEPIKLMTKEEKEKQDREYVPTEEELRADYRSSRPSYSIEKIRTRNKIILERMQQDYPSFVKWLEELNRYGANPVDGMVLQIIEDHYYRIHIFTERRYYGIRVKRDYLGCETSQRQSLAGETWTRGRDLPDGEYKRETWDSILVAIVSCELVRLGK